MIFPTPTFGGDFHRHPANAYHFDEMYLEMDDEK
jgi:hypothetical protein